MPLYSIYGLALDCDLPLKNLRQIDADQADITIVHGQVDASAVDGMAFRNWEAEPGRLLLYMPNVGRFLIENGTSITYSREHGLDDTQITSVLLGTALAAALMQRELLPIHSCCVKTDEGALLVMGKSGAGKSTTLIGLLDCGLPMMADDVTALDVSDTGIPVARPAFPAARLWQDALDRAGKSVDGLDRVREDLSKFYLPIKNFHDQPEPIVAMVWLMPSNRKDVLIEDLDPGLQIKTLSRFIYRKHFLMGFGMRPMAFHRAAATVKHARMLRVERPASGVPAQAIAEQILQTVAQ